MVRARCVSCDWLLASIEAIGTPGFCLTQVKSAVAVPRSQPIRLLAWRLPLRTILVARADVRCLSWLPQLLALGGKRSLLRIR